MTTTTSMTVPHVKTSLPGPKAKALIERDRGVVSPSYTRDYPLVIAKGSGASVEDVDGNVFLDCRATSPFSSSEPHEQWATGNLYDNVQAPLTARFWKNINIGWAGANTVFWNCEGDFLVQKPPTAQNFSFGHLGVNAVIFNIPLQDATKENGHIESLGRHVTPRSLYLTQLRERLGDAAVRQVALASQIG